jgi:hypothetical protein
MYGPTPVYIQPQKVNQYETQMLEMAMNDDRGSDELAPDDNIYTVSGPNSHL